MDILFLVCWNSETDTFYALYIIIFSLTIIVWSYRCLTPVVADSFYSDHLEAVPLSIPANIFIIFPRTPIMIVEIFTFMFYNFFRFFCKIYIYPVFQFHSVLHCVLLEQLHYYYLLYYIVLYYTIKCLWALFFFHEDVARILYTVLISNSQRILLFVLWQILVIQISIVFHSHI